MATPALLIDGPVLQPTDDAMIAARLLRYLGRDGAAVAFAEAPMRLTGGFDAAIFGFRLDPAPPGLGGPLILRLGRASDHPDRIRLEAAVHNGLADQGYPAPRVFRCETDAAKLGGPFMVMARVPGRTLAQGVEGLGSGRGMAARLRQVAGLPALLRRITELWVTAQLQLHAQNPAPVLQAIRAAGLAADVITFEGQLARMADRAAAAGLDGLQPGLAWLAAHRPPVPAAPVICHGDFHPLNIMAEQGRLTGVIDWANAVLAAPEMDLGSTVTNLSTVPLALPAPLALMARALLRGALRRYCRSYSRVRPLDAAAVRYFQVFRAMAQLVGVGQALAAGRSNAGAFHSPAGIANLLRHIRRLSGLTLELRR